VLVHELVAVQVSARPQQVAVRAWDGDNLTYAELWQRSGDVAAALADLDIGPRDAVVIAADRSPELVVAVLGVARSGACYVLLDPYAPPARQELVRQDVGARVVITAAGQPDWQLPGATHRLELPLPARDSVPPAVAVEPEDPLYVAYTSGSTGRPKGVIAPHRAVRNFATLDDLVALTPQDRVASLSSTGSDATTLELWNPLVAGATIVVLPQVTEVPLDEWLAVVRAEGITVMFLMVALFQMVAQRDPSAFASLDTLIFGGEAPHLETVRRVCASAPPRRLLLGYGPTEATVFSTYLECTSASLAEREWIPLGTPLRGYRIHVLDDRLAPTPDGAVGELCVGGPGVGAGYLRRPELTAQRFVRLGDASGVPGENVYRSGDLVRRHADGALEFVARVDRQVKIRGFRVELEEVERAVLATGLVATAVVERAHGAHGDFLACFYVPAVDAPDGDATERSVALCAALAARLPGYMIPARWVAHDTLPMTSNSKVDRARLLGELEQTMAGPRGHRG
jgi:amino acid adenylation domain-containing protein